MKDDQVHLKHILECLNAIQEYTRPGKEFFLNDRKTQKATLRELQELSESTQRLSQALKEQCPDIPWFAIAGFRNVLVHDYLGISILRVWDIIDRDLPVLETATRSLLSKSGTARRMYALISPDAVAQDALESLEKDRDDDRA